MCSRVYYVINHSLKLTAGSYRSVTCLHLRSGLFLVHLLPSALLSAANLRYFNPWVQSVGCRHWGQTRVALPAASSTNLVAHGRQRLCSQSNTFTLGTISIQIEHSPTPGVACGIFCNIAAKHNYRSFIIMLFCNQEIKTLVWWLVRRSLHDFWKESLALCGIKD